MKHIVISTTVYEINGNKKHGTPRPIYQDCFLAETEKQLRDVIETVKSSMGTAAEYFYKEASQMPNPFADGKDNNTPKGWITIPGEMVDKSSLKLMKQYAKEFEKLKK